MVKQGLAGAASITVQRTDRVKRPLIITYSELQGILSYQCGAGQAAFTLKIADDGTAHFETPYHEVKTIEEIGEEMLSKFDESPF